MVIGAADVLGVLVVEAKHDAILIVDANAVISGAIGAERMQPVARRHSQIVEPRHGVNLIQLASTAKRMPAFEDTLVRVDSALRYHLSKAWTVGLAYAFERFTKSDWRTDTLNPFLPGVTSSIWLGNDARDYTAHVVAVTLGYRFK